MDVVKALKAWDKEKIQASLTGRGIDWKFNPPAASHQGREWECLIRSIRRILHSLVGELLVTDEQLRTVLVDVEKILNDRPITPVSSDPQDLEALKPSHILLLRQNASLPPDTFEECDLFKATIMDKSVDTFEQNKRFLSQSLRKFKKHLFCL